MNKKMFIFSILLGLIVLIFAIYFIYSKNKTTNMQTNISEQEAIEIATKDAGGFLGTWVNAEFKNNQWHIKASSKSAKPPVYYILDVKGNILQKE